MPIAKYEIAPGDIILGDFPLKTEMVAGLTLGTFILSLVGDNGSGWTYTVRVGYRVNGSSGGIIGKNAYTTNRLTLGDFADTGEWNSPVGRPEFLPWSYGYWMYSETSSVSVPYGADCSGIVSCQAHSFATNANWTFGGNVDNGGFDVDPFPPSPIPAKPTFYLDSPSSITADSVFLNASMYGSEATLDYYHMGLWDRTSGTWISENLGGVRYADHIQFSHTYTGLIPETYHQWAVYVEDPEQVDQDNKNFYFTTLSWAKLATKVSSAWKTGITFMKVGGSWKRSKQSFMKVNGVWKRSKDQ